jgi:uncharacterized protein Smg (DUF494 family)
MYEKIIEIIALVISEIKFNNKGFSDINYKELENLGYTQSEISAALGWILDSSDMKKQFTLEDAPASDYSFRILHDSEKELFSAEAWSELNQLLAIGLINNEQLEFIIDKAASFNLRNVGKEMLISALASIMFNSLGAKSGESKIMLEGMESVN